MPSRRRVLATGATGLAASLAGCAGLFERPRFYQGYETITATNPLADGAPPAEAPPFGARLFTATEEFEAAIDWDAVSEEYEREWRDFDLSRSFAALFVTDRRLTAPGVMKGSCPLSGLDGGSLGSAGDTFTFEVVLERWPEKLRDPEGDPGLEVQLEQWLLRGNAPPEEARVDVSFVDEDSEREACSE